MSLLDIYFVSFLLSFGAPSRTASKGVGERKTLFLVLLFFLVVGLASGLLHTPLYDLVSRAKREDVEGMGDYMLMRMFKQHTHFKR